MKAGTITTDQWGTVDTLKDPKWPGLFIRDPKGNWWDMPMPFVDRAFLCNEARGAELDAALTAAKEASRD